MFANKEKPEMPSMRSIARLLPRGFAFALALTLATAVHGQAPQEGRDYTRLRNPIPTETGKKIEVIEFFSYGCPHCADFEPLVEQWLKTVPADVQFRRIPVLFQPNWVALARIYYTLEALGEQQRLTPEVFTAIHKNGVQLWKEATFFDWAASKGLDRKKVEDMYNSFGIAGKVNRAKQLGQDVYKVQSVPVLVVDGKFVVTTNERVPTHAAMLTVLDGVIAKARAEHPKG
jgi:thiol:disulfide interchange protein DsbA